MSQLSRSLEKRIQELTAAIESHKTELAAYERVLHMELSSEGAPAESVAVVPETELPVLKGKRGRPTGPKSTKKTSSDATPVNKTAMVAEVVTGFGSAGATPKDVDAYFTARNIPRSKNLIYNTLSYLVARNKLVRRDGKYFPLRGGAGATKKTATAKKAVAKKAAPTKKRHLSPEGLKRIKDALKKRWAAKRAAQAESGGTGEAKASKK